MLATPGGEQILIHGGGSDQIIETYSTPEMAAGEGNDLGW